MASLAVRAAGRITSKIPACSRFYATGPERPPMRRPDPRLNNPDATTTQLPDDLTFIHRPPPSLPSAYSYTTNPASPLHRPPTDAPEDTPLPPALRDIRLPKTRLTDEQIQEMRRLRREAGVRPPVPSMLKMCSVNESSSAVKYRTQVMLTMARMSQPAAMAFWEAKGE